MARTTTDREKALWTEYRVRSKPPGYNYADFLTERLCRAEEENARLLAACQGLLPHVEYHDDAGPPDCGWQSHELKSAIMDARAAIAQALHGHPQPHQEPC